MIYLQRFLAAAFCIATVCSASKASAQVVEAFDITGAYADFGDHAPNDDGALFLTTRLKYNLFAGIKPVLGVGAFSEAQYASAGLARPFRYHRFTLTPQIYYGYYHNNKTGKADLGYKGEFREALDLTYSVTPDWAFGVQAGHMSNAWLGDRNPGVNTFGLVLRRELGL